MVPSAASALFRSLDGYAIYGNFFSRHDEVYGWYPLLLPLGEQRELVLCPIRPAGRQSRCPKRFCSHSATKITKNLAKRLQRSEWLVPVRLLLLPHQKLSRAMGKSLGRR